MAQHGAIGIATGGRGTTRAGNLRRLDEPGLRLHLRLAEERRRERVEAVDRAGHVRRHRLGTQTVTIEPGGVSAILLESVTPPGPRIRRPAACGRAGRAAPSRTSRSSRTAAAGRTFWRTPLLKRGLERQINRVVLRESYLQEEERGVARPARFLPGEVQLGQQPRQPRLHIALELAIPERLQQRRRTPRQLTAAVGILHRDRQVRLQPR